MDAQQATGVCSARVIALPTAARAPVLNRRWVGRYPKDMSVVPIWKLRVLRRDRMLQANAKSRTMVQPRNPASQREAVVRVLGELLIQARCGRISGFLYMYNSTEGKEKIGAVGSYSDDLSMAVDMAERGLTAIRDHLSRGGARRNALDQSLSLGRLHP